MIAKIILPWFGGTSARLVNRGVIFSDTADRRVCLCPLAAQEEPPGSAPPGAFGRIAGAGACFGIGVEIADHPSENWKPEGVDSPVWEIFKLLLISVGLPYFLLSSNSPLIQAWFDRALPEKTAYRLYALSNIGSLLGLVTYPVLVEPNLTLAWQGRVWSLAYMFLCGSWRPMERSNHYKREQVANSVGRLNLTPRPAVKDYFLWIALAAPPPSCSWQSPARSPRKWRSSRSCGFCH